jgi:hypothetical protein
MFFGISPRGHDRRIAGRAQISGYIQGAVECTAPMIVGRSYGRRGLAAEPGPWKVRGSVPRERDRRDGSSEPDALDPEGA